MDEGRLNSQVGRQRDAKREQSAREDDVRVVGVSFGEMSGKLRPSQKRVQEVEIQCLKREEGSICPTG